jgi:hypothetical protein
VHSLAGFNLADELISTPPYSDPHHSASVASIVGGGQRMARPGAISCAHKGVLFLDDSTEAQSIRLERVHTVLPSSGIRCPPSTTALSGSRRHESSTTPHCNGDGVCIFSHTNGYGDVGVVGEPETACDRLSRDPRSAGRPCLSQSWRWYRHKDGSSSSWVRGSWRPTTLMPY